MVQQTPQTEKTPFYPRSPYACAKLYAFWTTVNYREAYDMYACNGILFNHESPVRGETFVTRKITRGLARIAVGLQEHLYLGNLSAKRDWGHAADYVQMQWLMLQQDKPNDYVIAAGNHYSVRQFVTITAEELGIGIKWEGEGLEERGVVVKNENDSLPKPGSIIISVDPKYFRPTEVETLMGDPTKAKKELGWEPKISFRELIQEMVQEDLKQAKRDALLMQNGYKIHSGFES